MKVQRREPELVTPAKPTPYEFKPLSDLDDQDGLRFQIPFVLVYPHRPSMRGVDPAKVIKEAVTRALVFYYPFAGRLREVGPTRKLIVECNAEGVLFVEADADVTLLESGDSLLPPFPYLDEFLFNVPTSDEVLNFPLLLIQVTRLKCGGFVWAIGLNHTMADAFGLKQFMSAVGEFSRGNQVPSIMPVWERHTFCASNSPNPTLSLPPYDKNDQTVQLPLDRVIHRAFFFGSKQLYVLRKLVAPHFDRCSNFEILTACMWKCRTIALQPKPTQIMSMICLVNARNRFNPPLVPHGYYGNCFLLSTVTSTAEDLIKNPLEYAVGLIKKAKNNVTKEYIQSTVDTLVIKGRPMFHVEGTYIMSDTTRSRFEQVDIGWGNASYGGVPRSVPAMASFLGPYENQMGENGIFVPICLPIEAMEIFVKELNNMLQEKFTKSSFDMPLLKGNIF